MSLETFAQWIEKADSIAVFTGAGISTESGIPDFRGPQGVWKKHKPVYFQDFLASHEARKRYWEYKRDTLGSFLEARPNANHLAIVELEKRGKLAAVITQNTDGLHQEAGQSDEKVLELHGSNRKVYCLDCDSRFATSEILERVEEGEKVPLCTHCQGYLKPTTISFGQALPTEVLNRARRVSEECELFVVIGSSLMVQPASSLPLLALDAGARMVIINLEPTVMDENAHLVFHNKAGEIFPRAVERAFP